MNNIIKSKQELIMNENKNVQIKLTNVRVLLMMSFSYSDDTFVAISPPPGLHWLRHYLNKNNIQCDVLDLDYEGDRLNEFLERTSKGYYQVIGMNVTHFNMINGLNTIWEFHKAADQSESPVVFIAGGQEATMNYEQLLKAAKLDLILTGFCEKSILKLSQNISFLLSNRMFVKDKKFSLKELSNGIDGIAYYDEEGSKIYKPALPLTHEEFRELAYTNILDLELPYFEYWEKTRKTTVDNMTFSRNIFVVDTARIYTTSHCPRRCGFCSSQTFLPFSQSKNSKIIMLSAEEVHDLILRDVKKYGAKHFVIGDDDFPVGSKIGLERLSDICDLIMESRLSGELPEISLYMQARIADFIVRENEKRSVNFELLTKLKSAGFYTFGLGVETFSDRLLKSPSVNKVGITSEDCKIVLDAMLDIGLNPLINIILCVPESTVDDLIQTIRMTTRFILKGCQTNVTAIMNAFPGAPLLDRPEYKYNTMSWKVPDTGETIEILRYFIPWDPQIAEIYNNLREETAKTRLEIIKNTTINFDTLPKPISALTMFITVAKLLKNKELEDELVDVTLKLIEQNGLLEQDSDEGLDDLIVGRKPAALVGSKPAGLDC